MSEDGPGKSDGLSSLARGMRSAQPWLDLAWRFMGSALVWGLAGYFADRWLGTSPLWLLVGFFGGLVVGFIALLKATSKMSKQQQRESKKRSE
ncbi:MAG TPA: AtpZ/AtpI family protein [Myxococcaceae bacterium]|nr:AtpZ/AtpI family protein [Myxococcaceae bacterium]